MAGWRPVLRSRVSVTAKPAQIAPAAQVVYLAGGSVTMLHQPTPRTDFVEWAEDTVTVLRMVEAGLVLLGPLFDPLGPVLVERGITVAPLAELGAAHSGPVPDLPAVTSGEDDTVLLQLTSGSTAEPKAVRITHANLYANLTAMVAASQLAMIALWCPGCRCSMTWAWFVSLTRPHSPLGLELVTVTPVDFLARPRRGPT